MKKSNENTIEQSCINNRIYGMNVLCHQLGISRQTAYNWIKLGYLKPHRLGGKVFFLEAEILEAIQNEKDGK